MSSPECSDHQSNHDSDHESVHESNHGSNHESSHGSNYGSNHGSNHGSSHGSNHESEHESEHDSEHDSDNGSDHGSESSDKVASASSREDLDICGKYTLPFTIPKSGHFPKFQRPLVLGFFSIDSDRAYCADMSQLKYIKPPSQPKKIKFDLNDKIADAVVKDEFLDEKLDNVLRWIYNSVKPPIDERIGDIVCYRGLLTTIMCTPYETQEGWIINATKWNGVIYLCASDTEEKKLRKKQASARDKRFFSWGFKFEQFMTSASPDAEPDLNVPQNQNEEFCVMFKSKLNSHRIMFGAEMDGVDSCVPVLSLDELQKVEFVELKTNRKIQHPRQSDNFKKYKLIKWWSQSFLVGINKIWCGYRDDNGIIRQVEKMHVSEFPKRAKGFWYPSVCMNFCDYFLTFVRKTVKEEEYHTVWQFEWKPGEDIVAVRLNGPNEFSFLHKWFADNAKKSR